ncbi:uncharacterized protein LOC128057551 isoform X1 [Budorcas taxicolor]|uniref:uncharacterized protein LOC128057551 isoform X1 n=1 Tax=Budorcas taxicolor TaxID=37181 RepID=UPI002284EB78|nr:uncharacterized protein LOC128057551 isoform X1 [Budorcas taxicolor]
MWELGELCRACFSHGPPTGPVQAPARRFDVGAGTARPSSRPPRAGALLRLSGLKQRGGSGICMRGGGAERRERRSNGIGRPRLTPANRRSRRKGLCDRETLKSCPCPPPSSYLAAADEKGTIQNIPCGVPCGSAGEESNYNAGDVGSIPGLGRFPWRKKRLPTSVFWSGEFHGLYSPWGREESHRTEATYTSKYPGVRKRFTILKVNR